MLDIYGCIWMYYNIYVPEYVWDWSNIVLIIKQNLETVIKHD